MSDDYPFPGQDEQPPEVTQADVEWALANDGRVRAAAASDEMLHLLGDGRPLFMVMAGLRDDAEDAMKEFATANLGDLPALQGLQSRVFCFRRAFETFEEIIAVGNAAKARLREEELQGR